MSLSNLPATVTSGETIDSDWGNDVVSSFTELDTEKVDKTTTVSAGTGLTGGGDLSANRSLAVSYGTASGTAAQGNDSRITGAVPNTRQVIAGTGLTGGGALSADRTLTVAYGTSGTTAAVGNDGRFTTLAGQTSMLQSYGRWYFPTNSGRTAGSTATLAGWTALQAFTGVTESGGTWTFANAGVYELTFGFHATYSLTLNTGFNTNCFIADIALTRVYAQSQNYAVQYVAGTLETSGTMSSGPVSLAAGATLGLYTGFAQAVTISGADGFQRTFFAVRRIS